MTYAFDLPPRPSRPVWLTTLADLSLLLVGFFVFVQASPGRDPAALARGFRQAFGRDAPPPATSEPMPVAAAAMLDFAPGSSALPASPAGLIAWARAAAADPRVTLKVTGDVDGSPADRDLQTGSGAVLAIDRARAVAATLARAGVAAPGRIAIVADPAAHGRRAVTVTMGFAGVRQ